MILKSGFSYSSVQNAALRMKMGIKPSCHVNDQLSDEDISRAWRKASMKVLGNKKTSG